MIWALFLAAAPGEQLYDPMQYDPPGFVRPDAGATRPALPFVWEFPPQTLHEVPIEGTTHVGGVPVRLRYLLVKGTPEELGRHFLASFKKQGLYIAPRQLITRLLTGVDPEAIITYSVVLQPNEAGHTTVILGEARPLDRKPMAGGLPLPPGAQDAIPVQFEGRAVSSFKVKGPAASVQQFYGRELPLRGWRPEGENEWLRPNEQLRVTLRPDGESTQVMLELQKAAPAE